MKKIIQLLIFGLLLCSCQTVISKTPTQVEFNKFFKESIKDYKENQIKISIHSETIQNGQSAVDATIDQIQVTLTFDIQNIEKVLVLKVPESEYWDDGTLNKDCRDDYVFIAGYNIEPEKNVTEITFRMRSRCLHERVRLLVWGKDKKGEYYLGQKTFRTYASHETIHW